MQNTPLKIAQQLAIPSQASTSTRNTVTSMNVAPISKTFTASARPTIPSILGPGPGSELGSEPGPEPGPELASEFSFNTTKNPIEKPPIKEVDLTTCLDMINTGKKVNRKYSYPSQFPNLTKSHALTTTIKGGKRQKMNKKPKKTKKIKGY